MYIHIDFFSSKKNDGKVNRKQYKKEFSVNKMKRKKNGYKNTMAI